MPQQERVTNRQKDSETSLQEMVMLPQVITPLRQTESVGVGVVAGVFGCEIEREKEKWETFDELICAACTTTKNLFMRLSLPIAYKI